MAETACPAHTPLDITDIFVYPLLDFKSGSGELMLKPVVDQRNLSVALRASDGFLCSTKGFKINSLMPLLKPFVKDTEIKVPTGGVCARQPILAIEYPLHYARFLVCNTITFIASLCVCLLLMSEILISYLTGISNGDCNFDKEPIMKQIASDEIHTLAPNPFHLIPLELLAQKNVNYQRYE